MATRARKQQPHDESPESVPVHEGTPTEGEPAQQQQQQGGAMEAQPRGGRRGGAMTSGGAGGIAPWAGMGGGLASVLPRMLLGGGAPGGLLSDPFLSPGAMLRAGGPFGIADKLMHDLEDDMRTITGDLFGGAPAEEEEGNGGALMLPGVSDRLWAAVDVKETPNEFVLSTDVRLRLRLCMCALRVHRIAAAADTRCAPRCFTHRCRACTRRT